MHSMIIEIISLILIIVYIYINTKDRVPLIALTFIFYVLIVANILMKIFPDMKIGTPSLEYTIALLIIGIPFLITVIIIGVQLSKQKPVLREQNILSIFKLRRRNIIFWIFIIFINIIGYMFDF